MKKRNMRDSWIGDLLYRLLRLDVDKSISRYTRDAVAQGATGFLASYLCYIIVITQTPDKYGSLFWSMAVGAIVGWFSFKVLLLAGGAACKAWDELREEKE